MLEFQFVVDVGEQDVLKVSLVPQKNIIISLDEIEVSYQEDVFDNKINNHRMRSYRSSSAMRETTEKERKDFYKKRPYRYKIIFTDAKTIRRSVVLIEKYKEELADIFINKRSGFVSLTIERELFETLPFVLFLQKLKIVKLKGIDPMSHRKVSISQLTKRLQMNEQERESFEDLQSKESRWYRFRRRLGLYTLDEIIDDFEREQKSVKEKKKKRKETLSAVFKNKKQERKG